MTDLPPEIPGSPEDPRPYPSYVGGEAGERLARAYQRWRESGYDERLRPQAYPDAEQQALYDLYDSGRWPPR